MSHPSDRPGIPTIIEGVALIAITFGYFEKGYETNLKLLYLWAVVRGGIGVQYPVATLLTRFWPLEPGAVGNRYPAVRAAALRYLPRIVMAVVLMLGAALISLRFP
jgi:hypothetical protein